MKKYIHIRIDDDLKIKLNTICDKKLITPSKLIRFLIKEYIKNEKENN
jgi:antitoxin component of RelBE/YafQ-DinJ toxin-antitoxin module